MEIVRGPFSSLGEILELINNLRIREQLRRFAPQHSVLFVDKLGQVVLVVRNKQQLKVGDMAEIREKECPGTCFFFTTAGMITAETELGGRIKDCIQALGAPPPSSNMEMRTIGGQQVLIIGRVDTTDRKD